MTATALLPNDPEATVLLRSMELNLEGLRDVVRFADSERALCTANDVKGFDLITAHDKAARGLRERFCGERWVKDENDNQAGIVNPHVGIRIIPCNFDENTGNPFAQPTNRVEKGSASRIKTRCNRTAWIPGLPMPLAENSKIVTWVLGICSRDNEPLRAELSLPFWFADKQYINFKVRIILFTGLDDIDFVKRNPRSDQDGQVEIVDIAIKRK